MPYTPPEETLVACVWIPSFSIQVERARDPALAGVPFALLSGGSQPVVEACSREAREAGLKPGMALREVMAVAPQAVLRVMDSLLYREAFARVALALENVSPLVEIAGPGCAYLALEGLVAGAACADLRKKASDRPGLYRTPRGLMGALERAIPTPWIARIGIATGKFPAWAVARAVGGYGVRGTGCGVRGTDSQPGTARPAKHRSNDLTTQRPNDLTTQRPDDPITQRPNDPITPYPAPRTPHPTLVSPSGRTCWVAEGQQEAFLKPLPASLLPVSPEMRRKLGIFGLRTLGQFAALPLTSVVAQFGREGRRAWFLARGIDEDPLRPIKAPAELVETLDFPDPEATLEGLIITARRLFERLLRRRELQGRSVRQVRLEAVLESKRTWSQVVTLKQPGARIETLFPPVGSRIEQDHPTEAVESLTAALVSFSEAAGGQGALFREPDQERQDRIAESLRQLRTQMGQMPVARVVEVEPWSRIPERRYHLLNCDP